MSVDPVRFDQDQSPSAQEVGTWALAYLGPGFRVQVRIGRAGRSTRLDGFMTPARDLVVLLVSATDHQVVAETSVSDAGRFEFAGVRSGGARLMFLGPTSDRPLLTPPFWV